MLRSQSYLVAAHRHSRVITLATRFERSVGEELYGNPDGMYQR
jgi:hypothetical protein